MLLEAERVSATEAWMDNVVTTVYTDAPREVLSEDEIDGEVGDAANLKEELEKELEKEKQELLERSKFTAGVMQYGDNRCNLFIIA